MYSSPVPKKPGVLDPLRVRIRRLQLIIGMGFVAYVLGAILTAQLSLRIHLGLERGGLAIAILGTVLTQLWAVLVLPPLLYGVARIIEIRPWTSAIGGVATGTVFQLSIILISRGFEGITGEHPARLVTLLATIALGAWLSAFAIRRGRDASRRADDQARKAAEARKDEYAEFAREAERLAARTESREQSETEPVAPPKAAP